jgi:hypothetical protein
MGRAVRDTFRPAVLLVLVTWMILIGIPVIFRGGSVRSIITCSDPRCGDLPWEAIWLVGCLAIVAVGFLTRKRAKGASR